MVKATVTVFELQQWLNVNTSLVMWSYALTVIRQAVSDRSACSLAGGLELQTHLLTCSYLQRGGRVQVHTSNLHEKCDDCLGIWFLMQGSYGTSQSRCKEMLHNFYVWTLTLLNPNPKSLSGNMVYQNRYSRRLIYLWPRLSYLFNEVSQRFAYKMRNMFVMSVWMVQ